MSTYKIIKIEDEKVFFKDVKGKVDSYCLYQIMDDAIIHGFSLEDQALIAEESVLDGFYAAKMRTDEKILVSLRRERYLPTFAVLFGIIVICSIFMSARVVHIQGVTLSGAFLFFPLIFAVTDIINELYGYNRVKRIIYSTAGCMLFVAFLMKLNTYFSGSFYGESDAVFFKVTGNVPYFLVSWSIALLISDSMNAYFFQKIKQWMCGRSLWLRSISSTFVSEIIFSPINQSFLYYFGLLDKPVTENLSYIMNSQGVKLLYAIAVIPIIYLVVIFIRKKDENLEIKPEYV